MICERTLGGAYAQTLLLGRKAWLMNNTYVTLLDASSRFLGTSSHIMNMHELGQTTPTSLAVCKIVGGAVDTLTHKINMKVS